jgi:hypothetical protein
LHNRRYIFCSLTVPAFRFFSFPKFVAVKAASDSFIGGALIDKELFDINAFLSKITEAVFSTASVRECKFSFGARLSDQLRPDRRFTFAKWASGTVETSLD